MAVTPTASNSDNSPWYKTMEDKGKVWEQIANEAGAKISGSYNAYIVEFEMAQQAGSHHLRIYGKRELTTVNNSGIISEVLKLQLRTNDIVQEKLLKVGNRNFLNLFFNLSGKYKHKAAFNGYKARYNAASILDKVIKTRVFEIARVNRLTIDTEGLTLEIQEIPMDVKSARMIRDFWRVIL